MSSAGKSRILQPFHIVVIAAAAIALIGLVRPPEGNATRLTREEFWLIKLKQPAVYQMVLGGDSRVLCDLSPAVMTATTGKSTLNFGFNFVGYEPHYLDALASKLDPGAADKTIVLGITPRALTPLNTKVSGYLEESGRPLNEQITNQYLGRALSMFRPASLGALSMTIGGRTTAKNFYPDGLMSVELNPPDPNFDLKFYRTVFIDNKVTEENVRLLLERVRLWTDAGIHVYGFRPPVAPAIFATENELSGFDETRFVSGFQVAGGKWIKLDGASLIFADGSHVTARDVPKISTALARAIASQP